MKFLADREITSFFSHFLAMLLSVAALVVLVIFASVSGSAKNVVGSAVFGASLVSLYLFSSIYHFLKESDVKKIFQHLDRIAIYILIAGTYTAVALSLPNNAWGWSLFGIEWGLALSGIILEFTNFTWKKYFAQILYLSMGWLAVIALPVLISTFSHTGFYLLLVGGIFYTLGFIFFVLDNHYPLKKWFNLHDVFHVLVMAGSFSHFWFLLKYVV